MLHLEALYLQAHRRFSFTAFEGQISCPFLEHLLNLCYPGPTSDLEQLTQAIIVKSVPPSYWYTLLNAISSPTDTLRV